MGTIKYLALIAVSLGGSAAHADISSLQKQIDQKLALTVIEREEGYLNGVGLDTVSAMPTQFQVEQYHDRKAEQDLIRLQSTTPRFSVHLLPDTLQVVRFMNSYLIRKDLTIRYSVMPPLKWNEEKVISLARGYAIAVLGQMPPNLSTARVQMTPQRDLPNYCNASWSVVWGRTDKKGHPFQIDCLRVELTDGVGPVALAVNFWSHYEEKDFEPIAETKARALAAAGAKQILGWSPGAGWLANFELVGDPTMELRIVNPNNLPDQPSIEALGGANELNARLAWVVTYKKQYKGPSTPDHTVPTGGDLQVWIDAENGQLLGGDFK